MDASEAVDEILKKSTQCIAMVGKAHKKFLQSPV